MEKAGQAGAYKSMAQEIEIKLKISDANALKRSLKRLGARLVGKGKGCVHEWNVIFDSSDGRLAKHGQLLRIRTETPQAKGGNAQPVQRTLLTFKRPLGDAIVTSVSTGAEESQRHKVREELELEVAGAVTLTKIFEGLGLRGWFRYEKYRTTFRLPASSNWSKGLLIEWDETPVGAFLELEGPPPAIDRAAQELGFSTEDYILKNYLTLYVEECRRRGIEPRDMVFEVAKSRPRK